MQIGNIYNESNPQSGRVYSHDGVSPTLDSMSGGNRQPKIIIDDTMGFEQESRIYKDVSPTLRAARAGLETIELHHDNIVSNNQEERKFRIRKLTPKECWRLMGFSDKDFHKASKVNSNSQLYKQAGNSIVVPVLEKIFANLFLKNTK